MRLLKLTKINPVFSSLVESNLERYIAPVKNNKRNGAELYD
jgi:hypothetical protein